MASWIGWAEISVGCEQRKIYLEHKDEFTKIFERAFILSSTLLVKLSVQAKETDKEPFSMAMARKIGSMLPASHEKVLY